jgi:hypothetical protein
MTAITTTISREPEFIASNEEKPSDASKSYKFANNQYENMWRSNVEEL